MSSVFQRMLVYRHRVNKASRFQIKPFFPCGTIVTVSDMSAPKNVPCNDVDRYENITKSLNDKRLYRGIKLKNQMKVLLISDPTTDKSAASLAVGVGSMNDFIELPGIAHFLEHMLFMGSKKYPQENDYNQFISDHAGFPNAFTSEHKTNFYFEISADHLPPALDRFAQFFLEPLMDPSATEREVMAVNSEHEKNIPIDQWRVMQLEKSLSKENHPYNHFATGNIETLGTIPKSKGIDVRSKLLEFHSKWYSSNIMGLTVLGKESLDQLEKTVVSLFEDVKNKNVPKVVYEDHPFGPEQLKRRIYVVPIKDVRSLKLSFSTPDIVDQFKTSPEHYVSNLIGHEGSGSLHSVLRGRGLCNNLSAGLSFGAPGFTFFVIKVDLTEEAMNRIDEIITLVFQYIHLLKTKGIQKWIFDENTKLDKMTFLFKDKESPSSYVTYLATLLDEYPFEDILSHSYLYDKWEPSLIEKFLNYLSPDNMKIVILSKSFEKIADQTERWYGTKYKVEKIEEALIEKWKTIDMSPELNLPPPNEFIPENFDLYPLGENEPKNPYVVQESSLSRIWFKQDDEFKLPKLSVQFELFSPISCLDPGNRNLTEMFVILLKDSLNEYAYAAQLAGLAWNILSTKYGMTIGLSGYNEKLPILLEKLMSKMTNFQVDKKRLEVLTESYIRALKNFETEQPHRHANYYLSYVMSEYGWTKEDLLAATKILQYDNMVKFIPELFSRVFLQGLIHGNCNKQKATEIVNIIETHFKSAIGVLPQQLLPSREVKIDDGCHFTYEVFNKYHSSSCYYVYFQCSIESTLNNTLIELFSQIVQEPCFNILRTQEQLGYIVMSGIRRVSGVQGFVVLVQSEKHPVYVNSRVEEFLRTIHKMLEDMTEEAFETHKLALATKKLEKPKQLKKLTGRYWNEITTRLYNFERVDMEVKQLYCLKKTDILDFFKGLLHESSSKRRKMAVHVISQVTNPTLPDDISNKGTKIEDVTVFKNASSLLPLPSPYITIAPVGTRSKL